MSDIKCRVCNEPYDYWGAMHGDMAAWEWDLFKKGAGCPCCKGIPPEELSDDEALEGHLKSVVFGGTDDPDSFEELHNVSGKARPAWEEPPPRVLWECEGCHVKVVVSNEAPYDGDKVEDDDIWLQWHGGDRVHCIEGHGFRYGQITREKPTREPEYKIAGKNYCPGCAGSCGECGKSIYLRSELEGDTYDEGSAFAHPDNPFYRPICIDCLEELDRAEEENDDDEDC